MSKQSRARARARKQSAMPKWVIIGGIIIVAAAAVAGAHVPSRAPRAALATASTETQPVAPAPAAAPGAALGAPGASALAANSSAPARKLLFFMNPNGYPCQTQLGILNSVADSLSKVAQVVLIKTTEDADAQKFETYGIRGLPTLVIADRDGREISRFSPGVQSSDAVLAALTR